MDKPENLQTPEESAPKIEKPAPPEAKPPAKVTAPKSKKVKNPKRVAAGKALAAKNKERLAKIKAFEESQKQEDLAKSQLESDVISQSEISAKSNDTWSTSVPLIVGGFVIVGGLTAFGYNKWKTSKDFAKQNPNPNDSAKPPSPKPSPLPTQKSKHNLEFDPFDDF